MTTPSPGEAPASPATGGGTRLLIIFILISAAIAVVLGVYGRMHDRPAARCSPSASRA